MERQAEGVGSVREIFQKFNVRDESFPTLTKVQELSIISI